MISHLAIIYPIFTNVFRMLGNREEVAGSEILHFLTTVKNVYARLYPPMVAASPNDHGRLLVLAEDDRQSSTWCWKYWTLIQANILKTIKIASPTEGSTMYPGSYYESAGQDKRQPSRHPESRPIPYAYHQNYGFHQGSAMYQGSFIPHWSANQDRRQSIRQFESRAFHYPYYPHQNYSAHQGLAMHPGSFIPHRDAAQEERQPTQNREWSFIAPTSSLASSRKRIRQSR